MICAPVQGAMGEIDFDTVAGDDRLFFGSDIARELLAQLVDQRRDLNAEKPVVVCVTQVGLRKTGCDDEWNALALQAGNCLLAARSSAEIEAPDEDISGMSTRRKLRVVVLHNDAGHHLGRHVVAVGVIFAVDGIGVEVVLRNEYEPAFDPLRKSAKDFDRLAGNNIGAQFLVPTLRLAIWKAPGAADVACECGRRHHFGTGEEALSVARSHAALEVAVRGRNADLALFQKSRSQPNAWPATGRQRDGAGVK